MSKHMRDCSGENHSVSNDIYMITRGMNKGKLVRIVLDTEDEFGDSFSKVVEVCFVANRYMESFTISQADLKLV